MFKKRDGILLVLALFMAMALFNQFNNPPQTAETATEYATAMPQLTPEEQQEEDRLAEEEAERTAERQAEQKIEEEERQKESEEQSIKQKEEQKRREDATTEQEQQQRVQEEEQMIESKQIAESLLNQLQSGIQSDPYNSGRYIDVSVNLKNHVVEIVLDENTYGSLNVDLKAKAYEATAQEILSLYRGEINNSPDEIIIDLQDSSQVNLATYRHDIIGDNNVLTMNYKNDNNF